MRPAKRELRRLFVKEGWSPQEIADHYTRSRSTVYRWLRDLDLRRERELWDLFVEHRWSAELLARYYRRSRSTVYRWLRDLGIRRDRDSWALTIPAEKLRALYDEGLTVQQIAERESVLAGLRLLAASGVPRTLAALVAAMALEQVTPSQVGKAMKHHQITRRQDPPRPQAKTPPSPDRLRRVLHEEGSVKGLAERIDTSVATAHRWLSRAGVPPLRPPGQRRSTAQTSAGAAFGPRADGGSDPARTISASRPVG